MAPIRKSVVAAVLTAALAVSAVVTLTTSTAAVATSPMTSTAQTYADAVLALMNSERAFHHLKALTSNADLVKSAHAHDLTMAKYNVLSHQVIVNGKAEEPTFSVRITDAGYHWSSCAENIAWTSNMSETGAKAMETAMYSETPPNDPHRVNILSSSLKNVGIDIDIDTVHKKLWLTEDFGTLKS